MLILVEVKRDVLTVCEQLLVVHVVSLSECRHIIARSECKFTLLKVGDDLGENFVFRSVDCLFVDHRQQQESSDQLNVVEGQDLV